MVKKGLKWAFLILVLLFLYSPIIFIAIFSFSNSKPINVRNFQFGFNQYIALFKSRNAGEAIMNSLIIAFVSATVAIIIGTFACVGIMAMRKRLKSAVMMTNQVPIVNADIVTAVSLVILFSMLSIGQAYVKLIIAHTLISLPYVVLSVFPRLRQINANTFEAAQDLGANPLQAMIKVMLPQLIPGILSGFMLAFSLSLDDFVITSFTNVGSGIGGGDVQTISTLVYGARDGIRPEFRALSAIIFVLIITVLVIFNIISYRKKGDKQQ